MVVLMSPSYLPEGFLTYLPCLGRRFHFWLPYHVIPSNLSPAILCLTLPGDVWSWSQIRVCVPLLPLCGLSYKYGILFLSHLWVVGIEMVTLTHCMILFNCFGFSYWPLASLFKFHLSCLSFSPLPQVSSWEHSLIHRISSIPLLS